MIRFDELFAVYNKSLEAKYRLRTLRAGRPAAPGSIRRGDRELVNFSSNDYLGLMTHPALVARAVEAARQWGVGAGASRLITGTLEFHEAIEAKLARLKGSEAALLFTSGYQANATILPALLHSHLLGATPVVLADALIHNSMHLGCRAAGIRPILYPHNDLAALEHGLKRQRRNAAPIFILTESVFSMDGDRADLAALAGLADRYDAFLYLDEAHATGVLGPGGMGLSGEVPGRIPLVLGTFSKGMGSLGAYVACSRSMRDYLINRCGGFFFSTALPPPVLGAIDAALDLVPTLDAERAALQDAAERVRAGFRAAGIDTGPSTTQIVPALIGGESAALTLAAALEQDGILGVAIRPPTVPEGTSRIRFALSASHRAEHIDRLIDAMTVLAPQARRA